MQEFEAYRQGILRNRLSSAIFLMAIPFYLSFSILDYRFAPDLWQRFLIIRGATAICFLLLSFAMSRFGQLLQNNVMIVSHGATLIISLGIGYMTYCTGGLNSHYYAGLNWIAIGSLAFWPCAGKDRVILIITIYGPLAVFELIGGVHEFTTISLLSLTFMSGTVALSIISNILSLKSLKEEFRLRFELQNLVRHKEEVIALKSDQAAHLKRLAKQFSPAVIQAIETQAISLDQRDRRKVAVIFIDVAGSTQRSAQLDHSDYQRALDMFFDFAIKKLMAKNITVANFMGDGLMAIANAPYETSNYERVAFEAAQEIISETNALQRTLREYWRGDFIVRIGISSGFANVGFFPNSDFGVYTAIGESVNLASRLCTAAESSTLATTKNVLVAVGDTVSKYNVKKGGSISAFKGFAGHDLEYFIVEQTAETKRLANTGMCPLCSHALNSPVDLGDCVLLKCTSCQYSDIQAIVVEASPIKLKLAG